MRKDRDRLGFTLIELLVVIAIIGVLLTILVPTISGSIKTAEKVKCASNLSQLGKALIVFSTNEGKFPVGIDRSSGYTWIWPSQLRKYTSSIKMVSLFHCPIAPDDMQWHVEFGSGLPAQDGYEADEKRLRPGQHFMSYGYNVWGAFDAGGFAFEGLGVYKGDRWRGAAGIGMVRNPAKMIALGDSNWDFPNKGDRVWSGFIGMYQERQWPLDHHSGEANLVFCDGHVESRPREEYISQLADPSIKAECERLWNRTHTNRRSW